MRPPPGDNRGKLRESDVIALTQIQITDKADSTTSCFLSLLRAAICQRSSLSLNR